MPKFYKAPEYSEAEIMELEEKDMHFPFSSKYMRYDGVTQQYVPTEELLLKNGIDLHGFLRSIGRDTPTNYNNELEYISDQIYAYIAKCSGSSTQTLKCLIAKGLRRGLSPFRFRVQFQDILVKQANFYVNNDDLTKTSGVDVEQKQWLNKGVLNYEDRQIDPRVKIKLMDLGLCWRGSYDDQFMMLVNSKDW